MAEVLENLFNGRLTVNELLQQLNEINLSSSDTSVITFVPFFLNYVRDSCSWLLDSQFSCSHANKSSGNESTFSQETKSLSRTDKASANVENIPIRVLSPTSEKPTSTSSTPFTVGCAPFRKGSRRRGRKNSITTIESTITPKIVPPDINDVHDFPPIGVISKEKKPVRRINPTQIKPIKSFVQPSSCEDPEVKSNNAFELSPLQEKDDVSLENERTLLKEARDKLQCMSPPTNKFRQPVKINPESLSKPDACAVTPAIPHPESVSMKNKLLILIEIYDGILCKGYIPNVTSELYFLFQLITSSVKVGDFTQGSSPFNSIHNCVFFVVSLLERQKDVLHLLDDRTLKSLIDIPAVNTFSPELVQCLKECISKRSGLKKKPESNIGEVAYRSDTDTRKNFPTNVSFTSFSKQRDLFYEILYAWQESKGLMDVHFERWFTKNIRQLVDMGSEMVNYFHLARLICSQMLISCLNSDEINEIPSFYHNTGSLDKLAKLNERLSARKGNPCPPPDFPGMQSFFEVFLKVAASSTLNKHLADVMKCQLLEIDRGDFHLEMKSCSPEEISEKFHSILMETRLLAKFLGYVTFLPYRSPKSLSKHIVEELLKFRSGQKPELDCVSILETAANKGQLILTVPWVVEYISMVDQVGTLLKQTEQVHTKLVEIYHGLPGQAITKLNFNFLRIVIGWLFENRNIPNVFYNSIVQTSQTSSKVLSQNCLDCQNIIDVSIIYSCCPYLQELRSLIEDFINCVPRKAPVRKITPLSMPQTNVLLSDEGKLEFDLEEYFYFLQPKVMKRIVEFSAERVACTFIHKINLEIDALKDRYAKKNCRDIFQQESRPDSKQMQSIIDSECLNLCREAKTWSVDLIYRECYPSIKRAFNVLAADQFDPGVVENGCKLSTRIALERLISWIESNIVAENIKNDLRNRTNKLLKKKRQVSWDCDDLPCDGDFDGSFTDVLKSLQASVIKIRCETSSFSCDELVHICQQVTNAFKEKYFSDFVKVVVSLTINIMVAITVHLPEQCTDTFVAVFVELWKSCPPQSVHARHFLCPGNMCYLQQSKVSELSSAKISSIMHCLMTNKIISHEDVEGCLSRLKDLKFDVTPFINILT